MCEKCGAIGVKHAFYGKERKFCSLSCARGPLPPSQPISEARQGEREFTEDTSKEMMPVPEVNTWNCCVEGVNCGSWRWFRHSVRIEDELVKRALKQDQNDMSRGDQVDYQ